MYYVLYTHYDGFVAFADIHFGICRLHICGISRLLLYILAHIQYLIRISYHVENRMYSSVQSNIGCSVLYINVSMDISVHRSSERDLGGGNRGALWFSAGIA